MMKVWCLSIIRAKTVLQFFTFIFPNIGIGTLTTNSSLFSLASMLPISDVRCASRPKSNQNVLKGRI